MAKARFKIVRAGSLWMAVQYTAIRGETQADRRAARSQISTPAREKLNMKTSWQKLMMVLAANFRKNDLFVTLTYRDENLPLRRDDADKRLTAFIRALRAYRAAMGQPLVYVRATEGFHTGGRLHHHLVINSTGNDYEVIRELWKYGDMTDCQEFGVGPYSGPMRWAKYMTKEAREKGRRYVGDRTWRTSRNVKKPIVESGFVDSGSILMPPAGAHIDDNEQRENRYGSYQWIMAYLPECEN